ncbi:hypothetical protein [Algiphilus sp.]|uniref:hypothetical protein n=1 Tax=Algiphilus sp. TaxID=1872431 RepID=UPI0025C4EAAF|nr:hypothetical protein [Algiphilus sp.]MCK5770733.1 hypothetical protein [Algiphilus sp.]
MKRWISTLALLAGGIGPVHAADIGAGVRASTLGLGAELSIGLLDRLVLRIPVSTFTYSDDVEEDGINYDGDLDLLTVGLFADVHVFGGAFHITGGLASNGNELNLRASEATGNESFEVGSNTYVSDPDDPFELRAGIDFESVAPYIGIGWGNAVHAERNSVYFKLELGVLYQGSPQATASATGSVRDADTPLAPSFDVNSADPRAQAFRQQLEAERATLEDDIDEYDLYPVLGVSVGYRF